MTEQKIKQVMGRLDGLIPNDSYMAVRNALATADDEKADQILAMSLHSPGLIALTSIFLGWLAIDRFAINDLGIGFAKLFLGWLTLGIWQFVDIFCCYKKAKSRNLQKITAML